MSGTCCRPTSPSTTATIAKKSNDDIDWMKDSPLLTTWNVDLVQAWFDDVTVVLSSGAQDTQNVDIVLEIHGQVSSPNLFSGSIWLACSKKSAWSTYTTFDISLP